MAQVDPDDDSVARFVVQHHRFDPRRNQRRNVVVAAYDNEPEFRSAVDELSASIRAGIAAGTRDPEESVSGVHWPPGHRAEQALGRLVSDAVAHGVDPRPLLRGKRLPPNVAVFGWDADGTAWSLGGEPTQPPATSTEEPDD